MDASRIKRQTLYVVIAVLWGAAAWIIAPRFFGAGQKTAASETHGPRVPPGSILVNVSMVGFDPASIETKAGQPLKLAFYRPNAQNCASEVVFPDLGIRKNLPAGQTTIVDVVPPKSGTFGFACAMNMLKGKLIVR